MLNTIRTVTGRLLTCCPWLLVMTVGALPPCGAQELKSIADIHAVLHASPAALTSAQADQIASFIRARYKDQSLATADHRHLIEKTSDGGGYALWAYESPPDQPVRIVAEKDRSWDMLRLGNRPLWVWAEKFPNFSSVHYRYEINGRRLGGGNENRFGFESYEWLPESLEQPDAPRGQLLAMGTHTSRIHYPGAQRDWWVYVPAQYTADGPPAKLIVFNDGGGFIQGDGNACTVLDNLLHQGKIPVMIAVFVNPGSLPSTNPKRPAISNRGNEYDTCTPRFATFLDEELLPIVREKYRISADPEDHAICGSSSGASCAFTAAWHRNDLFHRVVSFVGSYCDFRGLQDYPQYAEQFIMSGESFGPWKTAHDYPALIRKTEPNKSIKVFLQDGTNDLDNRLGNWFQNNTRMASALAYAGYDYRFVVGQGMHSKKHGMAILPEILVWLWSDSRD